ncbi:ATP-binding protein, partial [bacterium]|nr:ATP-binding protein [bacterium]
QVDALAQTGPRLAEVHAKQELVYRKLVADSEVERERARERAQVQQRHMEVAAAKKELGVRRKELFSCATRRQELMRKLVSLRDARFELRKKVAERLTQALDPEIRVAVRQAGNQDAYRKLLTEAFKQSGIRYPGFLESVVDGASPYDLAPLIQKGDAGHLAEHADIDRDRARRLVESLKGTEMLYKIEVADLDDLPRIELLEDGVYRDSGELSAGGRCTAILPIVLLESGGPLLVDQPEDNLDNKYMVDTIVKIVREAKLQRQLIFATHNPNIPVVGDAERVFILSSHRQRGRVEAVGTVEELKERIGNLLEGGKKAFLIRKERYGY